MIQPFLRLLARLRWDVSAGVTTLVALSLPVVMGATGLAFDLNRGYQQRVINQRAADMGALGAALAYKSAKDIAVLTPTAQDIAKANGLAGATVTAALVENYPAAGEQSVRVTVNEQLPITLGKVLGLSGSFSVSAQAMASLPGSGSPFAAPCYLALSGGSSAISITGGASIDSPGCSVAAVGTVSNKGELIRAADIISGAGDIILGSGKLVANSLRYAGKLDKPAWNSNVPAADKWIKEATAFSDPWANDADRVAAMAELADIHNHVTVPAFSNPTTPGGSNWTFSTSPSASVAAWRQSDTKFIVPKGVYDIGRLETGGKIQVTFADGSIIRIANGLVNGGSSTINFGNSDVYVNGGFNSGDNGGLTFGNGALWIGSGTVAFKGTNTKGNGDVVINAEVTLGGAQSLSMGQGKHAFRRLAGGGSTKLGAGDFIAASGVYISGDSEVSLAAGNVAIGRHSDGTAVSLAGSARFFMGDGTFSADGNITTAGTSKLVFGRTANHYINGDVTIAGLVLFGKGRYTISGNFVNGTGGSGWPNPTTLEGVSVAGFDQAGIDVTFILGGVMNLSGGAKTRLEAPVTTQAGGAIAELLFSSASAAASSWNAGSNNLFAGTIHLPNSALTMTGGSSTVGTKCMSLIAATITVSGGAATGSACSKMKGASASGGAASIRLVN